MTAKTMTEIGVITTKQNTSLTFAHYNRFFVLPHLDHDNYFMINRTLNVYVKKNWSIQCNTVIIVTGAIKGISQVKTLNLSRLDNSLENFVCFVRLKISFSRAFV